MREYVLRSFISEPFFLIRNRNSLLSPWSNRIFEYIWFHSFLVQKLLLPEVYNIEFNFMVYFCRWCYLEKKPCCMPFSIAINPHEKIVLNGIYVHRQIQISTLKIRVKNKVIFFQGRVHSCKEPVLWCPYGEKLLLLVRVIKRETLKLT